MWREKQEKIAKHSAASHAVAKPKGKPGKRQRLALKEQQETKDGDTVSAPVSTGKARRKTASAPATDATVAEAGPREAVKAVVRGKHVKARKVAPSKAAAAVKEHVVVGGNRKARRMEAAAAAISVSQA